MKYFALFLLVSALIATGCKKKGCTDPNATNYDASATKDDGSCEFDLSVSDCSPPPLLHTGYISSDETWTSDEIHEISGRVFVQSGAKLTIEPGTIIKCREGMGTLTSALIVQVGGQIHAEGTPQSPIIFTSVLDNIEIGQLSGTNLNENDKGLWGGVLILGEAPISAADGDVLTEIMGIPVGFDHYYGGHDETDNSGIFKYVSIRHAGTLFGAGNEINGLTLGGVGSGTSIDHVEVVACLDDGIQIFGGAVDVSNVIVGYPGDDGVETEMNFDGSITNATILLNNDSDFGIDMEGPAGQTYVNGFAEVSDISIFNEEGGSIRNSFSTEVKAIVSNVDFNGNVLISASYESDCLTPLPDALDNLIGSNPSLVFNNCNRDSLLINANPCTVPASNQTAAETAFSVGSPNGSDATVFNNWTWLSVNGKL
jgi:hypothetical protein